MKTDTLRKNLIWAHNAESDYFSRAESSKNLSVFWHEDSVFRKLFDQLDLTCTVDLACGQGRHSAQIIDRVGRVTLVDANSQNIERCKERFSDYEHVNYINSSGFDLINLASNSTTAVFSYDAMVHFEPQDVINYIFEVSRILKIEGMALFHYSNTEENCKSYMDNIEWRNFFSEKMMRAFAWRADLTVVASEMIQWGSAKDAVTLLKKARG